MSKKKGKRYIYPDEPLALPGAVVDNHTHLPVREDRAFDSNSSDVTEARPDLAELLARMNRANVRFAISSACEIPTIEPTLAIADRYPDQVGVAIAIHPNDAPLHCGILDEAPDGLTHGLDRWHREYSLAEAVQFVADQARHPGVLAIGETGLDYFRTAEAGKSAQIESFKMHIELAKALDLPLQIHDREAHADCIRVLKECGAPERTVFHCFSGDAEMARVCAENGWFASFAGPITYPANDGLREAFLAMPRELVLTETDAPYLTPAPWRGHPNASYVMAHTVRYQAELLGIDAAKWCEQVDTNSRAVYGI